MSRPTQRVGFTLVELLVVIAIIAMLMGLLVPAVQKVRAAANRIYCANNLHNIGLALHNYEGVWGRLPQGVESDGTTWINGDPSTPPADYHDYWSWMAQILQYVEQDDLYQEADYWAHLGPPAQLHYWPWGGFWLNPPTPPNPALEQVVKTWTCPGDPRTLQSVDESGTVIAFTAYVGVSGISGDFSNARPEGVLYFRSRTRLLDITDGTSNTLMVGERPPSSDLYYGWWFAGYGYDGSGTGDVVLGSQEYGYAASLGCPPSKVGFQPGRPSEPCDQVHFWSMHSGGANFLFADASVHFVPYSASTVLPALVTRSGGEVNPDY